MKSEVHRDICVDGVSIGVTVSNAWLEKTKDSGRLSRLRVALESYLGGELSPLRTELSQWLTNTDSDGWLVKANISETHITDRVWREDESIAQNSKLVVPHQGISHE